MAASQIIQNLTRVRGVERIFFLLSLEGGGECCGGRRERVFFVVGPKQAFCMCRSTNQFEEERTKISSAKTWQHIANNTVNYCKQKPKR